MRYLNNRVKTTLVAFAMLGSIASASEALASAPFFDPIFGNGGHVVTTFTTGPQQFPSSAAGVAVQRDGKIVVAGTYGYNNQILVVRYNADGSLDPTFGIGGKILTNFQGFLCAGNAVVVQEDGRIVVVGGVVTPTMPNHEYLAVRFQPWGAIDASFGAAGVVRVATGQIGTDVALQPDGKIVIVGNGTLVRLNPNGSFDTSFDGDGRVTVSSYASGVVLQHDGKILVGGGELARFNTDGSSDTTFGGGDGIAEALYGSYSDLAVQSDGKIVATSNGSYYFKEEYYSVLAIARHHPTGEPDTSFDVDGVARTDFWGGAGLTSLIIQGNGKIVAGGWLGWGSILFRFDKNGANEGSRFDRFRYTSGFGSLAMQPDGRIVAGGRSEQHQNSTTSDILLARYRTDKTPFDYDGDGRTDYSVFRPSTGNWYIQTVSGGFQGMQFGLADDKLAPADYDGDGKTDIAVYRPSNGGWYVVNSSNMTVSGRGFGIAEDMPAPADYDGDGKADICVFRPSQGTRYRQNSGDQSFTVVQFGQSGDLPTIGDFDSDDKSDIGIYRPSTSDWYNIRSSDGGLFYERFGQAGDRIVPADYDDDGRTDIAIWRPTTGLWAWRNSSNGAYSYRTHGQPNDIPIPGDYDGDGKTDPAVWRPSNGLWDIQRSSNPPQYFAFPWGLNGDRPTPSALSY